MSTFHWLSSFLLAAILHTLLAETHCPGNAASVPFRLVNRYQIVLPVLINHAGPYDFLLDTGSDKTIVGPSLAAELHLATRGAAVVSGAGFHEAGSMSQVDLLEAGSHFVASQEVLVYGLMNLRSVDSHIRGILGEDFLEHFDLLIDNAHKLVCLDDSGVMGVAMKGPRTELLQPDRTQDAEPLPMPLILSARLSDGTPPVRLKLDSGTNTPFLFNASRHNAPRPFGGPSLVASGADGDEKVFSALPPQDVKIGPVRLPSVTFLTLAHPLKDSSRKDIDGLLSMDLLRRVFINYAGHFAILEPW